MHEVLGSRTIPGHQDSRSEQDGRGFENETSELPVVTILWNPSQDRPAFFCHLNKLRQHPIGSIAGDQMRDFQYLSEALDSLDRLYDGESGARDVLAIFRVVGHALSNRNLGDRNSETADRLSEKIRSALPDASDNETALTITDTIRIPVADAWADLDAQRGPSSRPTS